MTLIGADALAEDQLGRWLVENSPVKIPFIQAWAWQNILGKQLEYARVPQQPPGSDLACAAIADSSPDEVETAPFATSDFVVRYQICFEDLDRYTYPNQLDATMYALAKRRLLYSYAAYLDTDDGLKGAVSRIVNAGGVLTLSCLDEAYELITAGSGRPTLIMSHSAGLRMYRELCRNAGLVPERVPHPWYYPDKGRKAPGTVDAFNGTPWLANDMMEADFGGTPSNRIYFMLMGDDGGQGPTRGVTGILPHGRGRNLFVKRDTNGVASGGGALPVKDTWVTMPSGVAVGSQGALSMLENFALPAACGGG
jgi:hypothetical protein